MEVNPAFDRWKGKWIVILIEYITYSLLDTSEMYGKEIFEFLSNSISLEINKATLYAILARGEEQSILEVARTVETNTTRGTARKYYRLTSTGKEVLGKIKDEFSILNKLQTLNRSIDRCV